MNRIERLGIICISAIIMNLPLASHSAPLPTNTWQRHLIDGALPYNAVFIDAADLNGDKRPDMITGPYWYQNPGKISEPWTRHTVGTPFNNFAAVFDFDNDGDMDLFGTSGMHANGVFCWARNDGAGNFTVLTNISGTPNDFLQGVSVGKFQGTQNQIALSWHKKTLNLNQIITVPANPSSTNWSIATLYAFSENEALSSGDIDADGDLDLLLGINWMRNNTSSWSPHVLGQVSDLDADAEPDRNRLADIDKDGDLDAVVGLENGTQILWFARPATPTNMWTRTLIANVPGQGFSMDVADMDRDGDMDVIVGEHKNAPNNRLLLFKNSNNGATWTQEVLDTDGGVGIDHHDGSIARDLDLDGDLDIMSIGWTNKKVWLFENKAIRDMFTYKVIDATPPATQMDITLIGDIDNDQDQDIVIGAKQGTPNLFWYANPTWQRRSISSGKALEAGGVLFDVNKDGRLDIIAGQPGQNMELYWYQNPTNLDTNWTRRIIENTYKKYHDQAIGDVDNDGQPELLISSQNSGIIAYYDIPANPTVEPWPTANRHIIASGDTYKNLEGLAIADLEGDGTNETIVGTYIFRQGAGGTWTSSQYITNYPMARVKVTDFNNDGKKDIVINEGESDVGRLTVCFGPTLTPQVLRSDLFHPHSLEIADFDQDGKLDIFTAEMGLTTNDDSARMFILFYRGGTTFEQALVWYGVPTHEAKVADINDDGYPDVVGKPYQPQNHVDIWINKLGGGTETLVETFARWR